jgi:Cdc6-like AAA superfamily ATPase
MHTFSSSDNHSRTFEDDADLNLMRNKQQKLDFSLFSGRDQELAVVKRALKTTIANSRRENEGNGTSTPSSPPRPHAVFVGGASGVGKSMLMEQACKNVIIDKTKKSSLKKDSMLFLVRGKCSPDEIPFGSLADCLEQLVTALSETAPHVLHECESDLSALSPLLSCFHSKYNKFCCFSDNNNTNNTRQRTVLLVSGKITRLLIQIATIVNVVTSSSHSTRTDSFFRSESSSVPLVRSIRWSSFWMIFSGLPKTLYKYLRIS